MDNHVVPGGNILARIVCCILGIGSLMAWNAMLTIADYYYHVFPYQGYLVYQLFSLVFTITLASQEASMNNRVRIISWYSLSTFGTIGLIILDLASHGSGSVEEYVVFY